MSELFVTATLQDMDTIEKAMQAFNRPPPQVHIKARFFEAPKGTVVGLGNFLNSTNSITGQFTGILDEANTRTVLKSLESRKDVETLAELEVITTSGRQTEMRATTEAEVDIVNDVVVKKTMEVGPVLDVVPYVLPDDHSIILTLIPSLTEQLIISNSVPKVVPDFRVRQESFALKLRDGQTVVMGGLPEKDYVNGKIVTDKSKNGDKEVLVLTTVTLVDPAGNRIHPEN